MEWKETESNETEGHRALDSDILCGNVGTGIGGRSSRPT